MLKEYHDQRQEEEPASGKLMGASQITNGGSTVVSLYWGCSLRVVPGLRSHFHRTGAGRLLLDWDAWVAFSEESWPQIKEKRLTRPILIRAVASEDDYYNYEFAPERWRYLAVRMRSPDGVRDTAFARVNWAWQWLIWWACHCLKRLTQERQRSRFVLLEPKPP